MQPLLYKFVTQENLDAMAETFYACVHLSIQIINENGQTLVSKGGTHRFCTLLQKHFPSPDSCDETHISASKQAISLVTLYF